MMFHRIKQIHCSWQSIYTIVSHIVYFT